MLTERLEKNKDNVVLIISSDRDMVQLCKENVIVLTAQNVVREPKNELQILTKESIDEDITASDFLLFKILIGDSSDGIPSVKYRFGPKKALKVILDKSKESLKLLLNEDTNILKSFQRNKKLISMKEIPKKIRNLIDLDIDEALKRSESLRDIING